MNEEPWTTCTNFVLREINIKCMLGSNFEHSKIFFRHVWMFSSKIDFAYIIDFNMKLEFGALASKIDF